MKKLMIAALLAYGTSTPGWAQNKADEMTLAKDLLSLWRVENKAIAMAQQAGTKVLMQSNSALQGRVTAEKQTVTLEAIGTDVQHYLDRANPIVEDHAMRLKTSILLPLLIENFDETELSALIAMLESPVKKKFEELAPVLERTYGEAVAEACGNQLNPMLAELSAEATLKLRTAAMTP